MDDHAIKLPSFKESASCAVSASKWREYMLGSATVEHGFPIPDKNVSKPHTDNEEADSMVMEPKSTTYTAEWEG